MRRPSLMRTRHRFIGFNSQTGTLAATPIVWPVGTMVGDLALFFGRSNSAALAPSTSGWQGTAQLHQSGQLIWKVLTLADLAATADMSGPSSQVQVWVFRGPKSAVARDSNGSSVALGVATITIGGFPKNARSRVLVAVALAAGVSTNFTLTSPSLGSISAAPSTPQGVTSKVKAFILVTPEDYINGTAWTINYGATTWTQSDLVVVEMTN